MSAYECEKACQLNINHSRKGVHSSIKATDFEDYKDNN